MASRGANGPLVSRALEGDEAWRELYARHGRRLRVWLASLPSGDPAASPEDVAADALADRCQQDRRVHRLRRRLRGMAFTIARLVLNNRRRRAAAHMTDAHEPGSLDIAGRRDCPRRGRPGRDEAAARDVGLGAEELACSRWSPRRRDGSRLAEMSLDCGAGPPWSRASSPAPSSPTRTRSAPDLGRRSPLWTPFSGRLTGREQRETPRMLTSASSTSRPILALAVTDQLANVDLTMVGADPAAAADQHRPHRGDHGVSPPVDRRRAPTAAWPSRAQRPALGCSKLAIRRHDPRLRLQGQVSSRICAGLPTCVQLAVGAQR